MHIVMLAAENDALPGGKVGGIGDVMRDVPPALAALGHDITVVMPSYGIFHKLEGAEKVTLMPVAFADSTEQIEVHRLLDPVVENVQFLVLEHPQFSIGGEGRIYCNDSSDAPFASDATKFALFSLAAGHLIVNDITERPDAIHLHDWHTAFLAILRAYDKTLARLQSIPLVYSIHNLAIQGIRPLSETDSSLGAWYPQLEYDITAVNDPRWPTCVNPMAAGIRLSDAIHTVSPGYAKEILQPSRVEEDSYYGGEGLELELNAAFEQGRLSGILNGCDYQATRPEPLEWPALMSSLHNQVQTWITERQVLRTSDYLADQRLMSWSSRAEPRHLITSIGRLTEQKARLFTCEDEHGSNLLEHLLLSLGHRGVFILLGSGDPVYEQFFARAAGLHTNFLFLNHYSETLAQQLYASGNLFLMPSSFEPCGISQMLSMRAGQPCLAHAVGGLRDTIKDNTDGFTFSGKDFSEQGENFLAGFSAALKLREQHPVQWQRICNNAEKARFLWSDSVQQYVDKLYQPHV